MSRFARSSRARRLRLALRSGWTWLLLPTLAVLIGAAISGVRAWVRDEDRPPFALERLQAHRDELSSALLQCCATPLREGHEVVVLRDAEVFDALARELASAESSVHVLEYIWAPGEASAQIVAALVDRARHGVECRVVVDAFGSPDFEDDIAPALEQAGCEVRIFRPTADLARTHRKLFVIDGRHAVTGGFGVRDDWRGTADAPRPWRDTAVWFAGPAVHDAQQAFAETWLDAGGPLLPPHAFAATPRRGATRAAFVASIGGAATTRAQRLIEVGIAAAHERLWIANAYFVPDDAILTVLAAKAAEGVDVRVLTAGSASDSKTSWGAQQTGYDKLLEQGVRVWEYQPVMMHAKTMVIDHDVAMIGTINLEPLSLHELDEDALVIDDAAIAEELAAMFEADCAEAEEQQP